MDLINAPKESTEVGGLRLVPEQREPKVFPTIEKQFVNFMFFRVNPEWRKLDPATKQEFKQEFEKIYAEFESELMLFSYSLVGFDSKADLMLWRIGTSLDTIQDMTAKLYRTNFGSFLETADNYLTVTKRSMFVANSIEDRFHVNAGEKKYHFLYPCARGKDSGERSVEERDALVEDNFMVGRKFGNIKIHLTHLFGFNDQEYVVSFETDEPKDFLALAEELKQTPSSKINLRGMPVYTCRQRPLGECLDAIG